MPRNLSEWHFCEPEGSLVSLLGSLLQSVGWGKAAEWSDGWRGARPKCDDTNVCVPLLTAKSRFKDEAHRCWDAQCVSDIEHEWRGCFLVVANLTYFLDRITPCFTAGSPPLSLSLSHKHENRKTLYSVRALTISFRLPVRAHLNKWQVQALKNTPYQCFHKCK